MTCIIKKFTREHKETIYYKIFKYLPHCLHKSSKSFTYCFRLVSTTGVAGGLIGPKRALLLAPLKGVLNWFYFKIYYQTFYGFSYGSRKGHSQHQALHELRELCRQTNVGWIIDADVSGFFNNTELRNLQQEPWSLARFS